MVPLIVWTAQPFQMRFLQVIYGYVTGDTQALLDCQALMNQVWEALAQNVLLDHTIIS
jgi:hypothetical protein